MSYTTQYEGSEQIQSSASLFPYTEIFNKNFPYYLSIGMSSEQYWEQDCMLVKYYREAEEIRRERMNQEAWLQGMYIYDALLRVSPVLRAFSKQGTKPLPYVEEPYCINEKKEERKFNKERLNQRKALTYMQAFMIDHNKKYEERK